MGTTLTKQTAMMTEPTLPTSRAQLMPAILALKSEIQRSKSEGWRASSCRLNHRVMIQRTPSKQRELRVELVRMAALLQTNPITVVIILLAFKKESIAPMPLNLLGALE